MKKITFSDKIKIFNNNSENITNNFIKIKKKKTPLNKYRKIQRTYCQEKAHSVATRIELEIKNPIILDRRLREESIAENLLIFHKFYNKVNEVYRLTNPSLKILIKKLSF